MIESLTLKNFRNFSDREISFSSNKNLIIGNNGKGKSNILEALSLPCGSMIESAPEYLLKKGEEIFYVGCRLTTGTIGVSYTQSEKKKKYLLGTKSTTRQKLKEHYPHIVSFHPMMMNIMYLGPSERRSFLDEILTESFPEYRSLFMKYKKVLTSRNKILKNISEGKSSHEELIFWDTQFIDLACKVYEYRYRLIHYFQKHVHTLKEYFLGKVENICLEYITKTPSKNTQKYIEDYIKQNAQKEILLRKTLIGPHLDDFEISIDGQVLAHVASRGEVKSSILGLKFLATEFIISHTHSSDILFLVDDILSELDEIHRELLLEHIHGYQSVITSIEDFGIQGEKIYLK